MAIVELDSFVTKFKHLLSTGFNVTLTLEAVNGKATVCLRSELGLVILLLIVIIVTVSHLCKGVLHIGDDKSGVKLLLLPK